jgi:hypothetical protein
MNIGLFMAGALGLVTGQGRTGRVVLTSQVGRYTVRAVTHSYKLHHKCFRVGWQRDQVAPKQTNIGFSSSAAGWQDAALQKNVSYGCTTFRRHARPWSRRCS